MKTTGSRHAVIAAGAAALTAAAGQASADEKPKRDVPKPLAELLAKIPTKDREEAHAVMAQLADGGPATVAKLVELVGDEFGDSEGVGPKYALHGLVHYASTPEADSSRGMVAQTLAKELSGDHSDELKAFICRQLQLCGRAEEVPALARLLKSDRLCEPATQALLAINTVQATAALREGLADAEGDRVVTIVKALGRQCDKASAAAIRNLAGDPERDVRLVTWYALANIGDTGSRKLLLQVATDGEPSYERNQATEACLVLARRLAESKQEATAAEICHRLMQARKQPDEVHVRCAALECLATAVGSNAVDDVMDALGSGDIRYRHPAARTALNLAAAIRSDDPAAAERLLKKTVEATVEEDVRQQAKMLLEA